MINWDRCKNPVDGRIDLEAIYRDNVCHYREGTGKKASADGLEIIRRIEQAFPIRSRQVAVVAVVVAAALGELRAELTALRDEVAALDEEVSDL